MSRRIGMSLGSLACLLVCFLALLSRCFNPDLPVCSFRCGTDPQCPEQYECRNDGYCHLVGTTEMCPFTADLLPAPDLLMPPPDSGSDGGGSDSGTDGGADAGADGGRADGGM